MPRRYTGVTAFVGLPGSGKSYSLVDQALRAQKRGLPVYANAGFEVEGAIPIRSFMEFARLEGPAVVVWDELPLYFSARKWADFPDGMLYKLTQIRKDSIELYYSTIHEMLVDSVLRRLTFTWVECRHMGGRLIRRTWWPPREFRTERNIGPYHREIIWMRKRVMNAYDTMGRVEVHSPERLQGLPEGTWGRPGWAEDGGPRLRVPSPPSSAPGASPAMGTNGTGTQIVGRAGGGAQSGGNGGRSREGA